MDKNNYEIGHVYYYLEITKDSDLAEEEQDIVFQSKCVDYQTVYVLIQTMRQLGYDFKDPQYHFNLICCIFDKNGYQCETKFVDGIFK